MFLKVSIENIIFFPVEKLTKGLLALSPNKIIANVINVVIQFMHDPCERHLQEVDRILQYPRKGLLFKKKVHSYILSIEVYIDADFAELVVNKRSSSGYCMFLGGN